MTVGELLEGLVTHNIGAMVVSDGAGSSASSRSRRGAQTHELGVGLLDLPVSEIMTASDHLHTWPDSVDSPVP